MTKARDLANASTALSAVSATELGYVDGVTSAIQTQIDGKQAINANVSTTELGYLDGVTSAIQAQLNQKPEITAGKNAIINGDFRINQRVFTSNTTDSSFNFDRWFQSNSGGTTTTTPQVFTPGTAPVVGYEGVNFQRTITASQSAAGDFAYQRQKIEDVRTFANQTVTVSFWAKAATGTPKIALELAQIFGSGGSSAVTAAVTGTATLSTSWARYSITGTVPSLSGKTIGTSSELSAIFWVSAGATYAARASSIGIQNNTFDIWGVQVEAGSVATPFTTATGTVQGELAACQRYFYNVGGDSSYATLPTGYSNSTTQLQVPFAFPVEMRTSPSVSKTGTWYSFGPAGSAAVSSVTSYLGSRKVTGLEVNVSGSITANVVATIRADNDLTARINWSAEL